MARKPRLHVSGGLYHVILRGNARQAVFFTAGDRHNPDFNRLDDADDRGLFEFVGNLAGARGEQQKGKNENACRGVGQQIWIEPGIRCCVIRHQNDQRVLVEIVVERPEQLGQIVEVQLQSSSLGVTWL